MRLASVGRMAHNRGSMNSPRCTIIFFLAERGTRLSETLRSAALCFCSLRVSQPVRFMLPFRMFKIHSLIQCTTSLLHFEMIALRCLQHLKSVIIRLHSLHLLHTNRRWVEVYHSGICSYETWDRRSYFASDPGGGSRKVLVSRSGKRYTDPNYLRGTLDWPSTYTVSYLWRFTMPLYNDHLTRCPYRTCPDETAFVWSKYRLYSCVGYLA